MATPRIVLATVGSLGDLHPFIAIGLALRARGADAVLAVPEDHLAKVRSAGLEAYAILPSFEQVGRATGLPDHEVVRRILLDSHFLIGRILLPPLADSVSRLLRISEGASAVAGSAFTFAAPIAAERLDIPFIHTVLQPMSWFSADNPPTGPGFRFVARPSPELLGQGWNKFILSCGRRYMRLRYGREIDRVRAVHGLAPTRAAPMIDAGTTPALSIGTYSSAFATLPKDAPQPSAVTGFPWYDADEGGEAALDPELAAFLDNGPSPLVVSLGSFVPYSDTSLYAQAAIMAKRLGKRAVLLVGEAKATGSDQVLVRQYAPHSLLFPRAAVVVHHGGIGTTGQALRSGRPQLIAPFMGDQPDNAARVARLGAGLVVSPKQFALEAPAALRRLMHEATFASVAAAKAQRVRKEGGAGAAAHAILQIA